ncbi:MAG TPA: ROK family protein [Candidatus Saccharimonadales bacterium]|nr:ROK family protein [Candidatus Saccharimonadales bacterium]
MYLAVDVGATKTLLAVFSKDGEVLHEQKIPTDHKYPQFLTDLGSALRSEEFKKYHVSAAGCAIPGKVDRAAGVGLTFGNLPWRNVAIANGVGKIIGKDVFLENDANLAGLFEARAHKQYKKVLYLTLSTGIGGGFIVDGKIDPSFADAEVGHMVLEYEGKLKKWEDFASGRALVERFGKKAEQLDNPFAWKTYAKDVARGLDVLLAVLQPEVVIFGGGGGAHLEKFAEPLKAELKEVGNNMVPIPPIIKGDKAEEAVIYGCYEFIRQQTS